MKVLVIHNRYLERGGEDEVVSAEIRLLEGHGHKVIYYEKSNEYINKLPFLRKLIFILLELNFSKGVYNEIQKIVRNEKPDIAHIHNIFFFITPSVYSALKEGGIPIVQSLHNYRLFCLKGIFFNKGKVCEKCRKGAFFNAITERCWNNSFLQSLFLARLIHGWKKLSKKVDSYIVTSEFSKDKFIEFGLERRKIYLKENFLTIVPNENKLDCKYALFIGRLVDYKGIETLMEAFKIAPNFDLKIIGDGPLRKEVYDFASSYNNVEWLGRISKDSLFEAVKSSSFLIFPSECYENMPVVIMESFAFSKPVLASNLGAIKEFVIDGVNGVLFEPGNAQDLSEKIAYLFYDNEKRAEMGKNANRFYRERFNKEKNYTELMSIYTQTINLKK